MKPVRIDTLHPGTRFRMCGSGRRGVLLNISSGSATVVYDDWRLDPNDSATKPKRSPHLTVSRRAMVVPFGRRL